MDTSVNISIKRKTLKLAPRADKIGVCVYVLKYNPQQVFGNILEGVRILALYFTTEPLLNIVVI